MTFVGADGTERNEPAAQIPEWLKFAPGADGKPMPVVRVVRVPNGTGYALRSYGPDGRLLWVILPVPPAPPAPTEVIHRDVSPIRESSTAPISGWF